MATTKRSLVEVQALKEELTKMDYPLLKAKLTELGVAHVWKGGVKKSAIVQAALKALEEKENEDPADSTTDASKTEESKDGESEDTEEDEEEVEDETPALPFGEIKITADKLDLFPSLAEAGFNIGDILVNEEGKPWYKKEDSKPEETDESYENSEEGTKGISTRKTIEEADAEIKALNGDVEEEESEDDEDEVDPNGDTGSEDQDDEEDEVDSFEKTVAQDEKEVIDESKFSLEEIQENIDITNGLIPQSIPSTKIILLHKLEALEAAKERKLSAK